MPDENAKVKKARQIVLSAKHELAEAYWVELTPELAAKILAAMGHQRPVRPATVKRYCDEMASGEWVRTGQGLVFNVDGDGTNGQHTCLAVQKFGGAVWVLVVFGADRRAYEKTDLGARRSAADHLPADITMRLGVASALGMLYREERGVIPSQGNAEQMLPPGEAPRVLERHTGILDVQYPSDIRALGLPPSIALYCQYRTAAYDSKKSDAFWDGLRTGAGLGTGDPRLTLRNMLVGKKAKGRTSALKRDAMTALIIKAWSAFVRGQKLKLLRWLETEPFPVWPGATQPASGQST